MDNFIFKGKTKPRGLEIKTVIIITDNLDSKLLENIQYLRSNNVSVVIINPVFGVLEKIPNGQYLITDIDNNKRNISTKNSTVILELDNIFLANSFLIKELKLSGFSILNEQIGYNHFQREKLKKCGYFVKDLAIFNSNNTLENAVRSINRYPLEIRDLSRRSNKFIATSEEILVELFNYFKVSNTNSYFSISESNQVINDVRIRILKHHTASKCEDDYVVFDIEENTKNEAPISTNKMEEILETCINIGKIIGCDWAQITVSIFEDKILIDDIDLSTNILPKNILLSLVNNENNKGDNLVCGYRELFEIPGLGLLVGKLDTGNGSSACSIHGDESTIVDNNLLWKVGDIEFSSKIVDYSNTEVGNQTEKRPIILLDIIFNGNTYRDVKFSVVNRELKSTPLLLNREFLANSNIIVDPSKVFLVTEKPEDYDPLASKGDPNGGITIE